MADHLETYGSANLRVLFINNKRGTNIKTDTLFENLYGYWTSYHDTNKSLFLVVWWYNQKLWKLGMTIKKKWNAKVLPLVNIIFEKYRDKGEHFNPKKFLEEVDQEKYFELLRTWKQDFEKIYLNNNPHLRFSPVRHQEFVMSKRRLCIG